MQKKKDHQRCPFVSIAAVAAVDIAYFAAVAAVHLD